jgi:hypothetical protein
MNRDGLGVAIGGREIRGLLVHRGVVQWHSSQGFAEVGGLAAALRTLLSRAPRLSIGTRITVVVSPAWVQVKSLSGLPPVKPARLASQLICENQQAFFLWKGSPALIAHTERGEDGTAWGAAFDRAVVHEITQAFRAMRMAVAYVTPSAVATVAALPGQVIAWIDGDERFEIEGDRDGLRRVERIVDDAALAPTSLPVALTELEDDAQRLLDAYAAAVAPRRMALGCRLQTDEAWLRRWARVRNAGIAAALFAAAIFAAIGAGTRAQNFGRSADVELARSRQAAIDLARNESELRRVTQVLNRVESFRAERGRVTRILGELAKSIPESTAMLTFHVDTVEGGFTAIAPHVADVLPELESIREIAEPRIVSSVTREILGGVHIERASFRFRRARQMRVSSTQR